MALPMTDRNHPENPVVVKTVEGHWRLHNERDILQLFQARTPALRPLLDEIEEPAEPPATVLKYLDEDLTRASRKQRLTRPEIKHVAKHVLEGLQVLHEDRYVHTGMVFFEHSAFGLTLKDRCQTQ
jgi:serine/threonine protein kinase